jgi:hypothetical protein
MVALLVACCGVFVPTDEPDDRDQIFQEIEIILG